MLDPLLEIYQSKHRPRVRIYSTIVTVALMIATAYFTYWGIIGLRTWV